MPVISKHESREFLHALGRIEDERVRYFLIMLTDAIAEAQIPGQQMPKPKSNASPAHFAEIAQRLNAKS